MTATRSKPNREVILPGFLNNDGYTVERVICEVHEPAVLQRDVETLLRGCGFTVTGLGGSEVYAVRSSA